MIEQKLIKLKFVLKRHLSDRTIDLIDFLPIYIYLLDCKLIVRSLSELLDMYLEKFIIINYYLSF